MIRASDQAIQMGPSSVVTEIIQVSREAVQVDSSKCWIRPCSREWRSQAAQAIRVYGAHDKLVKWRSNQTIRLAPKLNY